MLIYEIEGKPIPWMRAGMKGNKYYDQQLKEKARFKWEIKSHMTGLYSHAEPLKVVVEAHMPIPPSWTLKRRAAAPGKPHSNRPDLDNIMKFVGDALNDVLWIDDSLIYEVQIRKIYSNEPRTRISVYPYRGGDLPDLFPDARAGDAK